MKNYTIKYLAYGRYGESKIIAKSLKQAKEYFFDVWGFDAFVYDISETV